MSSRRRGRTRPETPQPQNLPLTDVVKYGSLSTVHVAEARLEDKRAEDRRLPAKEGTTGGDGAGVTGTKVQQTEQESTGTWTAEGLIAVLDSTREEVRAHRAQLFGVLAAAFLLPVATIAVQTTWFLADFKGYYAIATVVVWAVGILFLTAGITKISPLLPRLRHKAVHSDKDVAEEVKESLGATDPRSKLAECVEHQTEILHRMIAASWLFNFAAFFFILAAGIQFVVFVICGAYHVHVPCKEK